MVGCARPKDNTWPVGACRGLRPPRRAPGPVCWGGWWPVTATAPAQQGNTADSGQRAKRAPRGWWRRAPRWLGRGPGRRGRRVRLLVLVLVVVLGTVAGSMVPALTAPGTDSTSARIAEWARDHGMSPLVTWAEQRTYQPPTVGGAPEANSPLDHLSAPPAPVPAGAALPAPIDPLAQPPLPGEGVWQVSATVRGAPAMAQTFLRPDATHTSYTAAATWFDPHLVSAQLHPGAAEPGGTGWAVPDSIPPAQRVGLLAAFNSGSNSPMPAGVSTKTAATPNPWWRGRRRWCSSPTAP